MTAAGRRMRVACHDWCLCWGGAAGASADVFSNYFVVCNVDPHQGDQGDRLQAGEEVSSFVDCIVDDNDAANSKATFKVTLRIRGVFSRVLCRGGSLVGTGLSLYESPVNSAVYVLGGREHPSHRQHNRNDSDNAAAAAVGDGAGSGADGGADGDDQSHDPGGAASVSDVVEIGGRVYREVQTQAFGSLLARGMRLVSVGDVRIAGRMGLAAAHEVIKNMFKSRHGADDASVVLRFSGTMMDATIDARTLVHTASAMVRRLEEFARPTTGLDRKPVIRQPDIGAETGVGGHHSPGTQSRQSLQAVQSALTALRERVQPRDQARVRLGLQRLDVHGRGPPQRRTDRRRLVLQDASALRTARQQRLAETILPCIRRRLRALARGAVVVLEIVDSIQQLIHVRGACPPTGVPASVCAVVRLLRQLTYRCVFRGCAHLLCFRVWSLVANTLRWVIDNNSNSG